MCNYKAYYATSRNGDSLYIPSLALAFCKFHTPMNFVSRVGGEGVRGSTTFFKTIEFFSI